MTEAEARKKWCPFARSEVRVGDLAVSANRGGHGAPDEDCRCLASDCMAWHTTRTFDRVVVEDRGKHFPPKQTERVIEGHCGLTHAPELGTR